MNSHLDTREIANTAIGVYAGSRAAQGDWYPLVIVLLLSGGLSLGGMIFIGAALLLGYAIWRICRTIGNLTTPPPASDYSANRDPRPPLARLIAGPL
jgi:hypothetical protein